ncbi:MAG: PQQ-binding-like beta-propeller repeat protein [Acidobacteriota bacterium]
MKNLTNRSMLARTAWLPVWLLLSGGLLAQDNWSRFRGPNGTGVSTARNLPVECGPEKNRRGRTALPGGHSSPVLTTNRIFLTGRSEEKLLVICLDRQSGRQLWQRELARRQTSRIQRPNDPAAPSPVTDGKNVYAFFQDFGLISFDGMGRERWRLPLGPFNMFYGFGASPILVDQRLILPIDQDSGSQLLAIDKDTGRVRWKVERPEVISGYSTPTIYQPPQGPKQLLLPESFQLSAYSVETGERIWWVRGLACEMKSVISYDDQYLYINGWGFPQNQPGQQIPTTPFAAGRERFDRDGDGLIAKEEVARDATSDPTRKMLTWAFEAFDLDRDLKLTEREWQVYRAMMASENGLLAIRIGGRGDVTETAIRWKYQRPVPQVPSTLLYQGNLFMVNDSGILISFDPATGKVIKQGRLQGAIDKYFASPVGADGKVYLASQDGTISVVSATGEWQILAVNPLGEEIFATPAPVGDQIYVRTAGTLYCFGLPAGHGVASSTKLIQKAEKKQP